MTWSPGDVVLVQEVWNGRVWSARPMLVARDEGASVALWFPKGTRWKAPTTPPSRRREATRGERLASCALFGDWVFVDAEWDVATLVLMHDGDWHALWVSWLDGWRHWGWYVNLQRPYRRTERGFETMDLMLDVIVEPDGRWRWKDEDELEVFVGRGVFHEAVARRARHEGVRVARRAARNEPPFSDGWHEWRPERSWPLPELPAGWEERCR